MPILSTDEMDRANRFHFERDKNRFIAARVILRRILGSYLETDPQEIQFGYTSHGKPVLASHSYPNPLSFNLSHSGAFALFAITPCRSIGIDMELVRHDIDVLGIARRFFSKTEISSIEQAHKSKLHETFFQYWTRKEAFLKAIGKGISFLMEKVDVSLTNGNGELTITLPGAQDEDVNWYVQDLFPANGYTASIVIEGNHCTLKYFQYSI